MNSRSSLLLVVLTLSLMLAAAGCAERSGPGADGEQVAKPAPVDEQWPGGSLGGWESADGYEEAWTGEGGEGGEDRGGLAGEGGAYGGDESASDGDGFAEPSDEGGAQGGLEGGEIDDNADLDAFVAFAEGLMEGNEDPMIHWVDIERRHLVTVVDADGLPIADATVAVFSGNRLLVTGRTHADGRYGFFPSAYGSDEESYHIEAWHDGEGHGEAELEAGVEDVVVGVDTRAASNACRVDVAFIVDATGSMGGEIARLKQTISAIADAIAQSPHEPELRLALVDYRDRGDAYQSHAVNFTGEVSAFQRALEQVEASGGGDFPEDLNAALHDGLRRLAWRTEPTIRLAFIVADAPAHHYDDETYTYDMAMRDAAVMGVGIYPIASGGSDGVAELQFRQLAQFTLSNFIFVTEGGGSSSGSEGSDYHVDPETFDVEALDQLVIRLITENMEAGCRVGTAPR